MYGSILSWSTSDQLGGLGISDIIGPSGSVLSTKTSSFFDNNQRVNILTSINTSPTNLLQTSWFSTGVARAVRLYTIYSSSPSRTVNYPAACQRPNMYHKLTSSLPRTEDVNYPVNPSRIVKYNQQSIKNRKTNEECVERREPKKQNKACINHVRETDYR
ncbi:hypothetical protein BDN72DRAFT_652476 [Pluteus cervinus]|uniref:Uncharacterized protein n=1 Tax=Pluteus cervinus TaxID=181527 RepID=A0ACD3AT51_9AGAR|nr:hypothetical protein BDN72DRAFT_652476 [Pluteus cervinus]